MKRTILFGILLVLMSMGRIGAQNVGIGTNSPAARLDVNATTPLTARFNTSTAQMHIMLAEGGVDRGYIGSYSASSADVDFGTASNNSSGRLQFSIQTQPKMTIDAIGNVGIGSSMSPQYKLDVDGRMRLRHTSNTAGIWFDNAVDPARAFIGMVNNDYVGMYGYDAGWNLVMNISNGNTGIGTTAPTQRLDVNGNVRIRGSVPKAGSVLTSTDVNGNALWQDPVAFRTVGLAGGANVSISKDVWTKVNFNTSPNFNLSLNYQPFLSQFVCAEKGIYEFNIQLMYSPDYEIYWHYVRLMVDRGGNIFELMQFQQAQSSEDPFSNARVNVSSGALELLPGDKVWVETYINHVYFSNNTTSSAPLLGNSLTWFSGHLITRD